MDDSPRLLKVLNFVLFQIAWWGVFAIGNGTRLDHWPWSLAAMVSVTVGYLSLQYKFFRLDNWSSVRLILKGILTGFVLDGLMLVGGIMKPGPGLGHWDKHLQWAIFLTTFFSLWVVFITTLNSSLSPLLSRRNSFVVMSMLFAPLSYIGPAKAGFLSYADPFALGVALHSLLWGIWAFFLSK